MGGYHFLTIIASTFFFSTSNFTVSWFSTITMKFDTVRVTCLVTVAVLVLVTTPVDAFVPLLSHRYNRDGTESGSSSTLWAKVGIWYSSSTGNTDTVAAYIAKAAGVGDFNDIGDAKKEEIESADALIVGAPTWHTGADKQRSGTSWDEWLYDILPNLNVKGKKVAVFGLGDQQSYGDHFCDAAGELYDLFLAKGCQMHGSWSTEGYEHTASKAEIVAGQFCGLMCDEDNQYDLSEERAKQWVAQLKEEGFFS